MLYISSLTDSTESSDSQKRFALRKCYLKECWVLLRGKNWTDHQCSHYSEFYSKFSMTWYEILQIAQKEVKIDFKILIPGLGSKKRGFLSGLLHQAATLVKWGRNVCYFW